MFSINISEQTYQGGMISAIYSNKKDSINTLNMRTSVFKNNLTQNTAINEKKSVGQLNTNFGTKKMSFQGGMPQNRRILNEGAFTKIASDRVIKRSNINEYDAFEIIFNFKLIKT